MDRPEQELEERKRKEVEFHNNQRLVTDDIHVADTRWSPEMEETIKTNPLWANMKYYSIERKSRNFVLGWFDDNCKDKEILDYCCGNGDDSIYLAELGAKRVTGIDLSDVSVDNCRALARKKGLSDKISFEVRDAEKTEFEDDSFDVITEYGCLHHLDLDHAMPELARILRPDGKMICTETLGHNVFIHLYRKMTPHLRTEWETEHIIKRHHFAKIRRHFGRVELHFYHVFTLFGVPFRLTPVFYPLLSFLEVLDGVLLAIPFIRWQAWQTVFVLSEPRKAG
ncbi:uncharacterized protein METZ01_LOCUS343532 [marine metagenome]|jgi:ubiquinone/menaquinone biosynthesis C-methylase UbiE|uniref:Methyltransferase domain-containing protein n=1 Tax=marine metagenome TaxID=408172 RepID=A0A382R0S2_9ZZZZ